MSTFDDASLVFIPSGYKTSKAYSVKPSDGSGDLTFSRSNDTATRVNSAGLIEKVRTNLATYSNDVSNAAWAKITNGTYTITSETITDPFGNSVAVKKVTLTSGGYLVLRNTLGSATTSPTTGSVYIKKTVSTTGVDTDLSDGGVAVSANNTNWQRLVSINPASVYGSGTFLDINITTINEPVYVAYAQIEVSDFGATDYIATTSAAVSVGPVANVPRLDYLNSSCPRLLLEPQRTNLATYSEQFDNSAWTKYGGATVTANTLTSPDGYTNADTLNTASGQEIYASMGSKAASAITYTFSCFAKYNNVANFLIAASDFATSATTGNFNLQTGVATFSQGATWSGTSVKMENYGNGWYRCIMTSTSPTTTGLYVSLLTLTSGSAYIYGMQCEQASYATSYIPTLGSASTRGKDSCLTASVPSLIGQTEGTMFIEFERKSLAALSLFILSNVAGTTANSYQNSIYIYQASSIIVVEGFISNVQQFAFSTSALSVGTHKIAIAYKANDFALYIDGVQIGTDTSGSIPAMNFFTIAGSGDVTDTAQAVSQALLFKTRLSNSSLAELTSL